MNLLCFGDSLMQLNGLDTFPQEGWPQELEPYLQEGVSVLDFAKNGRSTKSFIDEGLFEEGLERAKEGDVALISFGHNDEKKEDPTRYTTAYGTYQENLVYMIDELKKKGVKSVLLTSIARFRYNPDGSLSFTHGEYPEAMRELAKKISLPLVDLNKLTRDYLSSHPEKENQRFYMNFGPHLYPNYPEGKDDHTHMRKEGAQWICSMVVPELKKIDFLKEFFR